MRFVCKCKPDRSVEKALFRVIEDLEDRYSNIKNLQGEVLLPHIVDYLYYTARAYGASRFTEVRHKKKKRGC